MALRVGILSPFYHNYNYGGKLQAYALTELLRENGADAVQICYRQPSGAHGSVTGKLKRLARSRDYRHAAAQKLLGKCLKGQRGHINARKAAFDGFDRLVPHTEKVYSDADMAETCGEFDAFVCGSDQVWNPSLFKKAYYLDFVPEDTYKFSYAASVACELTPEQAAYLGHSLASFQAVSVRESVDCAPLSRASGKPVELVADPVLLLERSHWERMAEAAGNRMREPYLFCYFLGYGYRARKNAERLAREKGLRIVTLPHLMATSGRYYAGDLSFGDERLYDVSPAEFVSLIRGADYVLTDSFHAAVLALRFEKQFLIFDRTGFPGMKGRLTDLLELYGCGDRFCELNTGRKAFLQKARQVIPYGGSPEPVERLRESSRAFLRENLKRAEMRHL